jgi:hypothetical protein
MNVFNEYVTEFVRVLIKRTQLKRRRWGGRVGIIGNERKKIDKKGKEIL